VTVSSDTMEMVAGPQKSPTDDNWNRMRYRSGPQSDSINNAKASNAN